jgi:hypothetical protein
MTLLVKALPRHKSILPPKDSKQEITLAARIQTVGRQTSTMVIKTVGWYQSLNAIGSSLGLTSELRNNGSA